MREWLLDLGCIVVASALMSLSSLPEWIHWTMILSLGSVLGWQRAGRAIDLDGEVDS